MPTRTGFSKVENPILPDKPKKTRGKKPTKNDGLRYYQDTMTRNRVKRISCAKQMIQDGQDKDAVVSHIMANYDVTESTAKNDYQTGKRLVTYAMVYDADTIRNRNMERLDMIAECATDDENYKEAIHAIDVLNKTANVYVQKEEITVDGADIHFTFGGQIQNT